MRSDLCGRCLVVVNTATSVVARFVNPADGLMHSETCPEQTSPRHLAAWAERMGERSGGDVMFEIDATNNRLVPFSTWHGDPVCSWHLWVLVDKEQRGRLCLRRY